MKWSNCYIIILSCMMVSAFGQERVIIDGNLEDWQEKVVQYVDVVGDGNSSQIDFQEIQLYNDEDFLFVNFELGKTINLQDQNDVTIYIDTDNDESTGFSYNGIGAEIEYNFGERWGKIYNSSSSFEIGHDDIFLVAAPTVATSRFELMIKRKLNFGNGEIFQSATISVVLRDKSNSSGDIAPSELGGVEYTFYEGDLDPLASYSIKKVGSADLRTLSYNALFDGLFDATRIPAFTRILKAIDADIIGFQEIYEHSSSVVANTIEGILPSASGEQWYFAGAGPDVHTISRYPILQSKSLNGNGAFLIDLPTVEEHLLFIVAHPPCCDNDSDRQKEIDVIMGFVRDSKEGESSMPLDENSPIIIVGDMNFVGNAQQLVTLLTGDIINNSNSGPDFTPDWNGEDFVDSSPLTTELPVAMSWYDEWSSFSPGRLDFCIYSESVLDVENSYSLFTRNFPIDTFNTYDISPFDTDVASDHLPIVVDFSLKNLTPVSIEEISIGADSRLILYPNPVDEKMEVALDLGLSELVSWKIYNVFGKVVLESGIDEKGIQQIEVDLTLFDPGSYVFVVQLGNELLSKKFVVF